MATLGNPKNTIAVLQKYQFNFQKKFGQNFLIDTGILEEIIEAAQITKDDFVLEIGPGIGTMTQYLCEAARAVVAVEIDTNLIPILKDTLAEYNNVDVLNEDILKVNISKLAEEKNNGKPIKVVANLPYYITTPIIMGLFESHVPIDSITIMVQKEVADRMQEGPGSKEYGALSLAVQYYAKPEIVVNVPPSCFMPQPKVGPDRIFPRRAFGTSAIFQTGCVAREKGAGGAAFRKPETHRCMEKGTVHPAYKGTQAGSVCPLCAAAGMQTTAYETETVAHRYD